MGETARKSIAPGSLRHKHKFIKPRKSDAYFGKSFVKKTFQRHGGHRLSTRIIPVFQQLCQERIRKQTERMFILSMYRGSHVLSAKDFLFSNSFYGNGMCMTSKERMMKRKNPDFIMDKNANQ